MLPDFPPRQCCNGAHALNHSPSSDVSCHPRHHPLPSLHTLSVISTLVSFPQFVPPVLNPMYHCTPDSLRGCPTGSPSSTCLKQDLSSSRPALLLFFNFSGWHQHPQNSLNQQSGLLLSTQAPTCSKSTS